MRVTELQRKRSKPIIAEIKPWLMNQTALPRSALGKAIGYALSLWDGLVCFLDDAHLVHDTAMEQPVPDRRPSPAPTATPTPTPMPPLCTETSRASPAASR